MYLNTHTHIRIQRQVRLFDLYCWSCIHLLFFSFSLFFISLLMTIMMSSIYQLLLLMVFFIFYHSLLSLLFSIFVTLYIYFSFFFFFFVLAFYLVSSFQRNKIATFYCVDKISEDKNHFKIVYYAISKAISDRKNNYYSHTYVVA